MMPVIWGQHQADLVRQIGEFEFKSKAGGTNPWMSDILTSLTPDDLAAPAAFMAGR